MEQSRFFPYSWHIDEDEEDITSIRIYGLNDKNENVCARVNNFTPYVYLELPDRIPWTQTKAQLIGNKIDEILGQQRPLKKCLLYKKKLYGAHMDNKDKKKRKLFPYLFCSFSTKEDIKTLGYKLRRTHHIVGLGAIKLRMHEQDADQILQMICCRNIPTAGWIDFHGKRIEEEDKITLCDHEFIVKWKHLTQYDSNILAKPKIMGFDIEVNSTNPSSMPNADRPGDKIFQISCVICREGDVTEDYILYLLSLGTPTHEVVGKNVIIQEYKTEADLLDGFTELVRKENPNIISGYNILGFDIPYMIARAKHNLCIYNFDKMGFHKFAHAKEKSISWSSNAYKNQDFQYLDAEGRLFVDLLPLVKRDYKLDNYRLKTVSEYFLGQTKDPLSVKGIFKCYRLGMKGGKRGNKALGIVGKYCVQDSVLVVKLMEHLQTWVGLCEMAKTCNVPMFTLYTQGQQIKVYSQVYKYCMYNNMIVEKDGYIVKDGERYVGAHVFPPVPGVYDVVLPFDFASLYPTTIIAYNIDYSTWVEDPSVPDKDCHVMEWEDHIGCVHDPNVIRKTALTKIIDVEKVKIKAMREKRNKTLDKFRKKEIMDNIQKLVLGIKPYQKERSELNKKKPKYIMCAKRYYRFLKEPKGVIPTILQNLLDARANSRAEIKVNNETIERLKEEKSDGYKKEIERLIALNAVLEKRQLAYKVSANSMYGAMGVRRGYLPFMPGAMCTTYMGRVNIEKVAHAIVNKYKGVLVYGDTDSAYIHFPHLKTAAESWDYAVYVAEEITKMFPRPIELKFENVIYWVFFILTKKRYMYFSCKRDGIVGTKVGKKGVLLARRDNSKFIRDDYEQVIEKVFNRDNRDDVLYFLTMELNKLCSGYYPMKDFIVTKAIGNAGGIIPVPFINDKNKEKAKVGGYTTPLLSKNPEERKKQIANKGATSVRDFYLKSLPAPVQLAEKMKSRGQRAEPGTRLEYVITDNGGHTAKQYVKIESAEYFSHHGDVLTLDYMYYLKLFTNPMDQVLNVAYGKDKDFQHDFILKQYKFRLNRTKVLNELKRLFAPRLEFIS